MSGRLNGRAVVRGTYRQESKLLFYGTAQSIPVQTSEVHSVSVRYSSEDRPTAPATSVYGAVLDLVHFHSLVGRNAVQSACACSPTRRPQRRGTLTRARTRGRHRRVNRYHGGLAALVRVVRVLPDRNGRSIHWLNMSRSSLESRQDGRNAACKRGRNAVLLDPGSFASARSTFERAKQRAKPASIPESQLDVGPPTLASHVREYASVFARSVFGDMWLPGGKQCRAG